MCYVIAAPYFLKQVYAHIHPIFWTVSLLEMSHFRGCYVQASMELGPEDVSLLERCPLRECYVQADPNRNLHVFRCHEPRLMGQEFVDSE